MLLFLSVGKIFFKKYLQKFADIKCLRIFVENIKTKIMTTIEKVLKANGILTTTEGVFGSTVIIAWDEFGIEEQARFKIDTDLSVVYKFLGY